MQLYSLAIAAQMEIQLGTTLQLALALQPRTGAVELHSSPPERQGAVLEVLHCRALIGCSTALSAWAASNMEPGISRSIEAVMARQDLPAITALKASARVLHAAETAKFACSTLKETQGDQGCLERNCAALESAIQLGSVPGHPFTPGIAAVPMALAALRVPRTCAQSGSSPVTGVAESGVLGAAAGAGLSLMVHGPIQHAIAHVNGLQQKALQATPNNYTHFPASDNKTPVDCTYQLLHHVVDTAAAAFGHHSASLNSDTAATALEAAYTAGLLRVSATSSPMAQQQEGMVGLAHCHGCRAQALAQRTPPSAPLSVVAAVTHFLGAAQHWLSALAFRSRMSVHLPGLPNGLPSTLAMTQPSGPSVATASLTGLAKVAAAEFLTVGVLSLQCSCWAVHAAPSSPLPAEDVRSDAALAGGVVIRSKLTKAQGITLIAGGYLIPMSRSNLPRSWLISGGLGSLGVLVADWLAGQGQAHIVLLGRTGRAARPPDAASTVLAGSSAAEVAMYRCDTSLASEVAGIGATCLGTLPVLAGIINSGGVLADAILSNQTAASVRASFAPKLMSVQAMQREAAGLPVGQQLLFSSVASLLGSPGQANYAAANAALEGWAVAACIQGVNSIALQWGAWAVGRCQAFKVDHCFVARCLTVTGKGKNRLCLKALAFGVPTRGRSLLGRIGSYLYKVVPIWY